MTAHEYEVVIVGGGPAGSSLAILLAERGRHVLLIEKESMPRDKLCGEFLSTEVEAICKRLGVRDLLAALGANRISRAVCTTPDAELTVDLPGTAHGVSRRAFDELLFARAKEAGAACLQGVQVEAVEGTLTSGFDVMTPEWAANTRFVVGAYGRRTSLDRKLDREAISHRSPYVAFKAHFEGPFERDTIELHCFHRGYCGLLVEEDGHVNVCWITHQDHLKGAGGDPGALLSQMRIWNPRLDERLRDLRQLHSFLAVSQLSFRRKELFSKDVCLVGDAAGMIAPLCGDGMGMAMRSAQLLAPMIDQFLDGFLREDAMRRAYMDVWRREFRKRMVMGRLLQELCMRPRLLTPSLSLASRVPTLAKAVVSATRG